MLNLKPIALVGGTVVCAVGFLLFIPLITELIYQTESWQSYAVPILIYLIVGGSLVITNRNVELKISEPNETICIFGMPEERIREFIETLKPHNGIKFVNSNTVSLMSGSTSAKTAFIAHHSVRDWAA